MNSDDIRHETSVIWMDCIQVPKEFFGSTQEEFVYYLRPVAVSTRSISIEQRMQEFAGAVNDCINAYGCRAPDTCTGCANYSGFTASKGNKAPGSHLNCAIHPYGPKENSCEDFRFQQQ